MICKSLVYTSKIWNFKVSYKQGRCLCSCMNVHAFWALLHLQLCKTVLTASTLVRNDIVTYICNGKDVLSRALTECPCSFLIVFWFCICYWFLKLCLWTAVNRVIWKEICMFLRGPIAEKWKIKSLTLLQWARQYKWRRMVMANIGSDT